MKTMSSPTSTPSQLALRKSLFWRIHFWAAIIASPFALLATLTGLLYVFTPQIEAAMYGKLEQVTPAQTRLSLDQIVAAAQRFAPADLQLQNVQPGFQASDAVKLSFAPRPSTDKPSTGEHQHHASAKPAPPSFGPPMQAINVYVNPYTGEVLGSIAHADRFSTWAQDLHSKLLQSDNWRWMIELAASWLLVMLLTGVYLWWPRGQQSGLPQTGATGRNAWKQWHAFLGVLLAGMSLIILTTGITWSKFAGENVRFLRDISNQASPKPPRNLQSNSANEQAALGWQAIWDTAKTRSPAVALQLAPPQQAQGVWRVSLADRSQPQQRFDLILDAYSGQTLYYAGWDKQTAFGKATAIGIPFHRGEFGWWNQALLLVFGLGVLFSLISGWVMFFKRRKTGSSLMPRLLPGAWRSSPGLWLSAVLLWALLPLLAISSVVVIALEATLLRQKPSPT